MAVEFQPLDAAAKDGEPKIVRDGRQTARAYWNGKRWAWDDDGVEKPIEFEPSEYHPDAELKFFQAS